MVESSLRPETNRRQSPRFACAGGAEILQRGSRWGWGRVSDFSNVGCYIEIVHLLPIGTEVQLQLTIADTLLDLAARVVSNDLGIGMGMEFIAVSQDQKTKLAEITRRITADESPSPQFSHPSVTTVQITREAAPAILEKIIELINEKGIVTRQDFINIVKTNK